MFFAVGCHNRIGHAGSDPPMIVPEHDAPSVEVPYKNKIARSRYARDDQWLVSARRSRSNAHSQPQWSRIILPVSLLAWQSEPHPPGSRLQFLDFYLIYFQFHAARQRRSLIWL